MEILINTVMKKLESSVIERVLWADKNIVILINVEDNSWVYEEEYKLVIDSIKNKKREIIDYADNTFFIEENSINNVEKIKRDRAYEVVMEFYKKINEPDIFDIKLRNQHIKYVVKKFNISRSTAELYLKKYWKRGMTKNSLLPDYYLCGGRGKEKLSSRTKRGKPSKNKGNGLNVDEKIKKIFKTSVNKFYNNYSQNTLKTAYNLMLKEYFSQKITDNYGKQSLILNDEIPTLNQFRYWFNKERNIKKEISSRYGGRIFQQKNRAILGSVRDGIIGSGYQYQIDATIGDIYLVSEFNKNWIIGRPVIYAVIDTFSYSVIGINVTLEGPSWEGAMGALINAFTEKTEFCKEYGIDIKDEEWPMKYIPHEILADRGEMVGFNADNLVNLGIKVSNTAPYRAEWKSLVEQYFRLLNIHVKPLSPGIVNPDFRQRGSKSYILDSTLNIRDLTKIIIKSVLYHNNCRLLTNFKKDIGMLEDDVKPIPREIWNWGLNNITGNLRCINKEELRLALLPRSEATITERGIKFKGIYYSCIKAIEEHWFENARANGVYKIIVSYNPNDLTNIFYIDIKNRINELCFILNKDSRYRGKSIFDIEYLKNKEKEEIETMQKSETEREINLFNDIEQIVKEAEERMDGIDFKPSNIAGIRENRRLEKELIRESKKKVDNNLSDNETNDNFEIDDSDLELIKSITRRR
ncbi:MAG: Mu transposase C-terminal domain-containing protein [Clostridium sp.]|uniref:Mu transposase C-terminal domain-containing protein n=1 Tax=Clostridium sp. TaxID=1506 RepID=UPI0025B8C698|nr:Mu transposase C-terminal domain-containing protein [Clostridium sp.]MCE5221180.1 Mu transposase C-terminal domain-containing protein [Clostridium sp.]